VIRLITSPGDSYLSEMLAVLADATRFVLVSGFASAAGIGIVAPAISKILEAGGQGRIIVAVDRQAFNASPVFEALLALKKTHSSQLSIGVALEGSGLMHAKALYAETPRGAQLLVGSANLTRSALGANHELGILLGDTPSDIKRAFNQFVTSIAPRSLDEPNARAFLESLSLLLPQRRVPAQPVVSPTTSPVAGIIARMRPLAPLTLGPEEHLAAWIRRGYLVGRGRRGLDALVLRLPQESLVRNGYIRPPKREVLGIASHETRSMGYGVDLIPTTDAEVLRRDARRVSLLLAKLTLNLPCFGLWMPESYWEVFLTARKSLESARSLSSTSVLALAERHRGDLKGGGLEREVDRITSRLDELHVLVPGRGAALRDYLIPRFQRELALRTPDILASCIEFRTARQRWSPFDQTETPYRQLMVDVLQATFASTYRTGDWPRRFRSHAARRVAESIEGQLGELGRDADSEVATAILDQLATWEGEQRPMAEIIAEFRRLVDDDLSFPAPDHDALINATAGTSIDDDEGADDDVR
jgi:HKD family nuclease